MINRLRKLEDCVDDSITYEFYFSEPIKQDNILALGKIGDIEYFDNFPRHFYRLIRGDDFQFKGVEGELTARLTLFRGEPEKLVDEFNEVWRQS